MIKTLLEYRRECVSQEVREHIETMPRKMKRHANPKVDLSRSETICYDLLNYIQRNVEDRTCRILFYLLVLEVKNECFLSSDKGLYFKIESMIEIEKEPLRDVLFGIFQDIEYNIKKD